MEGMGRADSLTVPGSWDAFKLNYLSMAFPMILGCLPTCFFIFNVIRLPLGILGNGVIFALVVTINMTVPMALWMRYRMQHCWKCTGEMSGPMVLPLAFLIPYWEGLVPGFLLCGLICSGMFLLMLVVMLYRREMYSQPHHGHNH